MRMSSSNHLVNAMRRLAVPSLAGCLFVIAALSSAPGGTVTPAPPQPVAAPAFPPLPDQTHLANAHVVTAKVISGAQPEGDESFKALEDLGVRTIVSVDGAAPDVGTARRYGLRYVHLPITYSGVTPEE